MSKIVFLNGEWKDINDAKVSILDQGILRGDGLFETLRAHMGKVPLMKGHLERLYQSAEFVGLTIPLQRDDLEKVIFETLTKNHLKEARIRLVVTRGVGKTVDPMEEKTKPTLFVIAEGYQHKPPLDEYEKGVAIITVPVAIFNELFPLSVKSISYFHNMAAKRHAKRKGAFDAIFTDSQGYCTEGTTSNLFWVKKGQVFSTPLNTGALPGVTRKTIISILKDMKKPLLEEKIHKKNLYKMDEVFLTSSMIQILPVTSIDGKKISDRMGPMTRKIKENFEKYLEHLN